MAVEKYILFVVLMKMLRRGEQGGTKVKIKKWKKFKSFLKKQIIMKYLNCLVKEIMKGKIWTEKGNFISFFEVTEVFKTSWLTFLTNFYKIHFFPDFYLPLPFPSINSPSQVTFNDVFRATLKCLKVDRIFIPQCFNEAKKEEENNGVGGKVEKGLPRS